MYYFYILFGLLLSSIYSYFVLPINSGDAPNISITLYPLMYKGMIIIPINNNIALHIHHWMVYSFILYFYSNLTNYIYCNEIVYYFLLGLIFQGIMYDDYLNVITNNPY